MSNSGELKGKLAIVTGAGRGIGTAIATSLASKGANIAIHYSTSSASAEKLSSHLSTTYSVACIPLKADLSTDTGPEELISSVITAFKPLHTSPKTGETQIDIIVNNAGLGGSWPLPETTTEDFWRLYRVNVLAPLLLIKAAQKYLPFDRSGRIVNISSVSSSCGFVGQSIYGGTKAALEAMTRTWARELAGRASVTAVNPGPVDTEMYDENPEDFKRRMKPFIQNSPGMGWTEEEWGGMGEEERKRVEFEGGRRGKIEDVAGVVSMLCGKESAWCTGSVVNCNGGMVMNQ